jgi:hypothetical protein
LEVEIFQQFSAIYKAFDFRKNQRRLEKKNKILGFFFAVVFKNLISAVECI